MEKAASGRESWVDGSSTSGEQEASNNTPLLTTKSKKDEKLVRWARTTVMLVLLLSALTVATLAYVLLSKSEAASFKSQFKSSASQVILMANRNAVNVFTSFRTMAAIYPSTAKLSNDTLPFLTLDSFDRIADGFRNVSKAAVIFYAPLLRTEADVQKWNNYSSTHTSWIAESRSRQVFANGENVFNSFSPFVYDRSKNGSVPSSAHTQYVAPSWQMSPLPAQLGLVNVNAYQFNATRVSMEYAAETGSPSLTEPVPRLRESFPGIVGGPISFLHQPIYNDVDATSEKDVVGILAGLLAWKYFFDNVLPEGQQEVIVVVESCLIKSTFLIQGSTATFLGDGDLHNATYGGMSKMAYFVGSDTENIQSKHKQQCKHLVHVFPTKAMESAHMTNTPLYYAIVVLGIFGFAGLVFLLYDFFVSSRQNRTERQADASNAIVQEMFPGNVAQRLFSDHPGKSTSVGHASSSGLSSFGKVDRQTIAELHPDATVLFADISGFTAWSSTRDPHQVFTLLESIFQSFDATAKKYNIFKVETIGDCYVAACGVPKTNPEHALVMSRFARAIMTKFRSVCHSLELTLGPDTGDLSLRVGMHSGPVTAGVLRGERARFQLFGDTVNTASRMESTGKRERVHISEQTAMQLIAHGKQDWIVKRDDAVEAKGKGKLVTFWLRLNASSKPAESVADSSEVCDLEEATTKTNHTLQRGNSGEWDVELLVSKTNESSQKKERLAHWNSELLLQLLQRVVSRRAALQASFVQKPVSSTVLTTQARTIGQGHTVVEEVVEIIDMPEFVCTSSVQDAELSDVVVGQLRAFVAVIASLYNDNPFHNFEHASHVTMSVNKLLGRIVAPKIDLGACSDADQQAAVLHDHTCGITSDPLTQFAVVLSALIHDLDHPGVSNAQFMKEDRKLAARYKEKSVAEQNSVDLAWSILMMSTYDELRAAIFSTETELRRFRNLLVNSIIATDIFDKDLGTLRKNRWNKAFYETTPEDDAQEVKSRKATIVIEHLIQASDVAHTMQHWHVYQKWNERLFNEMMMAYRDGRSDKDPSEGWYGGELWFFDNYVIPLAKKLKDCGVFGVSSDEYLNYAQHNRDEWEMKGKDVVAQYREEFEAKFGARRGDHDAAAAAAKAARATL